MKIKNLLSSLKSTPVFYSFLILKLMEISVYSHILSIGVLALFGMSIFSLLGYCIGQRMRLVLEKIPYENYLSMIGIITIWATTFAMIYQLYYELEVCTLCWWQRIFIFPIDIIIIVSIWKNIRWNHIIIGILALLGAFFAWYHYYYHFIGWVLKLPVFLPCEQGWLLPACTDHNWVLTFWFVTIPLMSLVVLLTILWLSYLASKVSNRQ